MLVPGHTRPFLIWPYLQNLHGKISWRKCVEKEKQMNLMLQIKLKIKSKWYNV